MKTLVSVRSATKKIRLLYLKEGIHTALDYYLNFLPFPLDEFQLKDLHLAVSYPEVAWIRTRRGGKSRDLTIIAVFLAILEYKVIWRAPFSDQIKQAVLYFQHNPFVKKIAVYSRSEVDIFFSPSLEVGGMTVGKTASLGCDCLIYDEGGKVEKDKLMYQNYLYSRAMIAASTREKFIIHGTTPAIYTAIEETVEALPAECVSTHPYTDCHWIPDAFIEDEALKHANDPWYIDQEYRCMFIVRGGAFFTNIKTYQELGIEAPTEWDHMGVDFNGIGHMLVRIRYDDKYIYCGPDLVVQEIAQIKQYIQGKMHVEVEEGGANMGYVNQCDFPYEYQRVVDQWSSTRCAELCKRTIVVDERLNQGLIKNLREAIHNPLKEGIPKKRDDQHYLDGLMHAIHPWQPKVKTYKRPTIQINNVGNFGSL